MMTSTMLSKRKEDRTISSLETGMLMAIKTTEVKFGKTKKQNKRKRMALSQTNPFLGSS